MEGESISALSGIYSGILNRTSSIDLCWHFLEQQFCATLLSDMLADQLFLGHDLLAWLTLAVGGALVVGNAAALVRPPVEVDSEAVSKAMRRRSRFFIVVGAIASIWALATLISS